MCLRGMCEGGMTDVLRRMCEGGDVFEGDLFEEDVFEGGL
jgi:hypothetical protein